MKLRCMIVDDEPMARKGMEEYVQDTPFLEHSVSCENALVAGDYLKRHTVDLILLDIQMPNLTGIEFLKSLTHPPLVIVTTAHPDYALESYSLDVIDYIVKPPMFERFRKAAQKAFEFYSLKNATVQTNDYFFLKCNHVYEKILYDEVLYAESLQNYVVVHTAGGKRMAYITLAALEDKFPRNRFMKIHKSFIVALDKVTALDGHDLMIGAARIPISRPLKDEVMRRVLGDKVIKR